MKRIAVIQHETPKWNWAQHYLYTLKLKAEFNNYKWIPVCPVCRQAGITARLIQMGVQDDKKRGCKTSSFD